MKLQRKEEKEMIRYYIIATLVFAAIVTVEKCFPVTAACLVVALVMCYGKKSDTY